MAMNRFGKTGLSRNISCVEQDPGSRFFFVSPNNGIFQMHDFVILGKSLHHKMSIGPQMGPWVFFLNTWASS